MHDRDISSLRNDCQDLVKRIYRRSKSMNRKPPSELQCYFTVDIGCSVAFVKITDVVFGQCGAKVWIVT